MSLDSITDTIMQTINGNVSVRMITIDAKQKAEQKITAEIKNAANIASTVIPTESKLISRLAVLEGKLAAKIAERDGMHVVLTSTESAIMTKNEALELAHRTRDMVRQAKSARRARAKAKGEEVPPDEPTAEDKAVDALNKEVKGLEKELDKLHQTYSKLSSEVSSITDEIDTVKKSMFSIRAQKSPEAAVAEAKKETEQAQQRVDNAKTPEEKKAAKKQLAAAQEQAHTAQSIADDNKKAVDNIMKDQEPKYLQLRAEIQTIEMGTRVLNYMITQITTKAATPSVIGSASPNPAYMVADNNIGFGIMYYILQTCKASSIRFLALAKEIGYTPTSEIPIIESITACETAMLGFGAMAPGSTQLNA